MASLKKCIEAKCKDCTYDSFAPGTWREQVEACGVTSCPLYEVRPKTVATINLVRKGKADVAADDVLSLLETEDEDEDAPAAAV